VPFVLHEYNRKQLNSNLQMRDALVAKFVFHQLRMQEVAFNLSVTENEVRVWCAPKSLLSWLK